MGRFGRELYISAIYHVYNRGNNKLKVLGNDENKLIFLELLEKYRERFGFKVFAICLMDNHYHMIIETSSKHNISRIMHGFLLAYSSQFRRNNSYVGHLWQSRFKSRVIETEKYFVDCLEYIHINPVSANMVERAEDHKFSSASVIEGGDEKVGGVLLLDSYEETLHA